ncbi:hypothetical protein B0T10DRAFT_542668 [Thelonectria olida]|uniref:Uncharacterized protein n=1 Tax=Thelonectria olida TaxID=1576542 RepID=A0A9P8WJC2_9HYPO|nr:hypothetical protein B0T10DRAFT_542668 [Thelonectria olida]
MDTLNELESPAQSSSLLEDPLPTKPRVGDDPPATEKINELRDFIPQRAPVPKKSRAVAYLVKLQAVKSIAGLPHTPEVMTGADDTRRENDLGPNPTFLQLTLAEKALSHGSAALTLGLDVTLPQNRAESMKTVFKPSQDEYQLWYFMYGTLADPKELSIVLPTVTGGRFLSRNTIVDADIGQSSPKSQGKAFLVQTEQQEEALRFSVTDKFEVCQLQTELVLDKLTPNLGVRKRCHDSPKSHDSSDGSLVSYSDRAPRPRLPAR